MRMPFTLAAVAAVLSAVVLLPSAAQAVTHTVQPGETLWSIAAADGLTVAELAAANGLSSEAQLVAGSALTIPVAGSGATAAAPPSGGGGGTAPASSSGGGYVVQPGDTLSGIAAGAGLSTASLAAANGLSVDGLLVSGTTLTLSGSPAAAAAPAPAAPAATASAPVSSGGSVSSGDVAGIAAQHGVPGSLAAAVAWQESGFNNAMVSSTGARGVMQVMPGTWQYVQDNLGTGPLDPGDPLANVTAGSAYLRHLLDQSGGDTATAIASYYQGPGSVAEHGVLPETQRYVDNVLALQGRFGG
jgi:LysM repeat protein